MIKNKMLAPRPVDQVPCREERESAREGLEVMGGGPCRGRARGGERAEVSLRFLRRNENKMLASGPMGQVPCREERRARHVQVGACAGDARADGEVRTRVKDRGGGADSRGWTVEAVQTRVDGPWRRCRLAWMVRRVLDS